MIGQKLGPYEILAKLGEGGMGEVYRARDTMLDRDVAIKVLPDSFATDPDRVARFEREAKTLAALNHPNVGQIYGVYESGSRRALVLELVEGPTLADRIAMGPVPLEDALPIARQIADSLEAAHEHGIVHRDLKPANIKLRADGTVKVLDFGLAKAIDPAAAALSGVSQSPTLTTPAMTVAGVILGTAAYMSPEQARGGPVEKRADIWAFGVVLYEMLSGRRLFDEPTVSDTLAAVLKGDVALDALPRETPVTVRALIARCLTRDWRRRLRDIGEARIVIEDAIAHPDATTATPYANATAPRWWRLLPWSVAAVFAIVAGLAWAPWKSTAPAAEPVRLSIELGPSVHAIPGSGPAVVLSPDGSTIAFRGRIGDGERSRVFLRHLSRLDAVPLTGTDGADNIFFSPDGNWIAFSADNKLKKIRVDGGDAITLCDVTTTYRSGDWTEDGHIVFASSSRSGLSRVSANGGKPEPVTTLNQEAGEITHRFPQVLPGGRAVVFTAHTNSVSFDDAAIMLQSLSGGTPRVLLRGGYYARYVPSGHLVYLRESTLMAVPFDLDRLEVTGAPVRVVEGVATVVGSAYAQFSISKSGVLAYLPSAGFSNAYPIMWLDALGKLQPMRTAGSYLAPRFSPDGRRVAMEVFGQGHFKIWVYDWMRDVMSRLTGDVDSDERQPLWSPDGRHIVFSSDRIRGQAHLYAQQVDSAAPPQQLTDKPLSEREIAGSWLPDGKTLAITSRGTRAFDIMTLHIEGTETASWKPQSPTPLLNADFSEQAPAFSPDGRWLAYISNETGRNEVYVRRFPELDGREQISSDGGALPTWSRARKELFYTSVGAIRVVGYAPSGAEFRPGKSRVWAQLPLANIDGVRNYDLHPDGERMVILQPAATPEGVARDTVILEMNFQEELRRVTP